MNYIYLRCESMYAAYEPIPTCFDGKDFQLVEVGFCSRYNKKIYNYDMERDYFFDIYNGTWPTQLTKGDLADWDKVK